MRIGMILDKEFPPDPRVENEALSLVDGGYEVYLFCLKYKGNQAIDENFKGIKIRRIISNRLIYKLSALAYTLPFYTSIMKRKISTFIKENKIDVLHIHDIRIAEAAFRSVKHKSLPIVLDLHDNMPEIMKFYPHLQKFPGKYLISPKKWKQKEEYFIARSDKVITVSNEFKEEIIGRTKTHDSKIIVVPNTVRKEFYQQAMIDQNIIKKYKDFFVVLYVGDTGLRRGLLTAISGIALLKEKIKNIKLVIVGTNSTDNVLRSKVNELDLTQQVDFQGWQDVKLFPSYIMSSEVCISPLDRNLQHDVAYANKLFQYMSFAKPLLVSNALAQKELIKKTNSGLVHIEKNADDFADKVLALYSSKEFRTELGQNGKAFIEKEFNWEQASWRLLQTYKDLKI